MTTLFISDLHLDGSRPEITELFLRFLQEEARQASALYILGDFFEAWIGDDDDNPHHARVMEGLREITQAGIPTYLMHGNRDFLIGRRQKPAHAPIQNRITGRNLVLGSRSAKGRRPCIGLKSCLSHDVNRLASTRRNNLLKLRAFQIGTFGTKVTTTPYL